MPPRTLIWLNRLISQLLVVKGVVFEIRKIAMVVLGFIQLLLSYVKGLGSFARRPKFDYNTLKVVLY